MPIESKDDPLLVLTVAEAQDYIYVACCQQCRQSREVELKGLPSDLPVRAIRERLVCACGARKVVVTFLPRDYYDIHFRR